MTKHFSISLGQMDVRIGQPDRNLAKVEELAARASRRGSNFLLLPELWSTGYDLEHSYEHATRIDSGVFASVSTLAQKYKLAILGSCLSLVGPGQYANTAVLFDEKGDNIADYSKIHLFKLMDEPRYLTPGNVPVIANTKMGKAGLAICYDLRFPELFRYYALQGASMVMIPAEWPWPRLSHWRTLLRARAIENQLFIFACNRVGSSKKSTFFGHSMIIDPWGEIVIEGGEDEELITTGIDLGQVKSVRTTIPVFEDRRPDIYGLGHEQIK
jgi:predicted amidohydrolase